MHNTRVPAHAQGVLIPAVTLAGLVCVPKLCFAGQDGMEDINSTCANRQRENMVSSKPSRFCFLLIGMALTQLLTQNAGAKLVYPESLGKLCSLSPSLTVVSRRLAPKDDRLEDLFSVSVVAEQCFPCHCHCSAETGNSPSVALGHGLSRREQRGLCSPSFPQTPG